jgi:hypothetical protein
MPSMKGSSGSKWEPSVIYLLVLVFAELAIMAALRTFTKNGG